MKRGYSFDKKGITKYWRCPECHWKSSTRSNLKDMSNDTEFGGENARFIYADRFARIR